MGRTVFDKVFELIEYERGGTKATAGAAQRIRETEERLGYSLPDDMKTFYKEWDRVVIHPEATSPVTIEPVTQMARAKDVIKPGKYHIIDCPDSWTVFAHDREGNKLVIDLAAKRGQPSIIDAFDRMFPLPTWTWEIAKTFTEFLKLSMEDEWGVFWLTKWNKYGDATTNRIGKKAAQLIPQVPVYDVMEFENLAIHDVYAQCRIGKNKATKVSLGLMCKETRYWHEHIKVRVDIENELPMARAREKNIKIDLGKLRPRPEVHVAYSNSHRWMMAPITSGSLLLENTKRWQYKVNFDVTTKLERIGKARFQGTGLAEIVRVEVPFSLLPAGKKKDAKVAQEIGEQVFGKGKLEFIFVQESQKHFEFDMVELNELSAEYEKKGLYFPPDSIP